MFETVSVFGERAAVWSPVGTPRVPGRVLIPGRGPDVWAWAASAKDAADTRPARAAARPRRRAGRSGRPTPQRVVLPSDPPAEVISARRLGTFVPNLDPVDDDVRDRLCDDTAALAWAEAALELGCWRSRLDRAAPGAELAAALDDRPDTLAPRVGRGNLLTDQETRWADAVLASIQTRARLIGHLQAAQYADLAELSEHYPAAHEFLASEIALALSCNESTARAMLGTAEAFRDRLPGTLAALSDGTIDGDRAYALVAATTPVSRDVAAAVEAAVLPGAGSVTAATVRRRAERAVIALDPDGLQDRHQRRRRERYVSRWPEADGMAGLKVYSSAEDIATIHEALTCLARELTFVGDTRDLGNRRVDALVEVCTAALDGETADGGSACAGCGREEVGSEAACNDHAGSPADDGAAAGPSTPPSLGAGEPGTRGQKRSRQRRRSRPLVRVTMPITALLGTDEPCELDGWGPITAQQARVIAADATLTRLVCDPLSGTLLDYGLTRYDPPETLKQHVRARDRTCSMPGCSQPADHCDIDHVIPARPDPITGRPTLGPTSDENLGPDCRHHHLSKDANGGFHERRDSDGSYTWTTPLGRSYRKDPEQLWHPPPADQLGGVLGRDPGRARTGPPAETNSDPPGRTGAALSDGTAARPVDEAARDRLRSNDSTFEGVETAARGAADAGEDSDPPPY